VLRPVAAERLIQPFQQPERVIGFFNTYRQTYPVSREVLRDIAGQFHNWVENRSQKWGVPIVEAPESRRDKFLDPFFRKAKPNQVVAIIKRREPARIMIAIGNKKDDCWHLQMAQRWVVQYNFYLNDARWGRMFVRRPAASIVYSLPKPNSAITSSSAGALPWTLWENGCSTPIEPSVNPTKSP
jgi:hypothetical protein